MIIVNKQGTRQVLSSLEYENEDELKDVFLSNISELLSGVTTIETKSFIYIKELDGIDVALIGNDGSLFLAETKLARNNDARQIVAQILDYATKLQSKSFRDFEDHWTRRSTNKSKTLLAELENSFEIGNEVLDQLKENLEKRRFNLILVMDKINNDIRGMAETLKSMPNWFVYGIELTKYSQNDLKIFIPNILWEEEVEKKPSYRQQIPSDSKFLDSYTKAGLGQQIKDFVSFFVEFEENKKNIDNIEVYRTPKYLNFGISSRVISICLHYDPQYEGNIQFWCFKKEYGEKIIEILSQYEGMKKIKPLRKSFGKVGEWDLRSFSKVTFEEILQKLSKIE